MIKQDTSLLGILSLILLSLIFATMGIFARYLDLNLQLFEQVYLRILFAAIMCLIVFYSKINYKKLLELNKNDYLLLSLRGILMYIAIVLITKALLIGKYSNASFIGSIPILPLFGYFILREKISKVMSFYIFLAFIGVACISIQDFQISIFNFASILTLLSVILFDFTLVLRKFHSNYLNNYESSTFMLFVGGIFILICSILFKETLPTIETFSLNTLTILLIAASFNIIILLLVNYGFEHVKASIAGNLLTLEAVFALCYGVLLYQEILTIFEIIGSCIILLSVLLVNYQENKETSKK